MLKKLSATWLDAMWLTSIFRMLKLLLLPPLTVYIFERIELLCKIEIIKQFFLEVINFIF